MWEARVTIMSVVEIILHHEDVLQNDLVMSEISLI